MGEAASTSASLVPRAAVRIQRRAISVASRHRGWDVQACTFRVPGAQGFTGNLEGRYWAEHRTCQDDITVHGDAFRFYEIGFRCCRDR